MVGHVFSFRTFLLEEAPRRLHQPALLIIHHHPTVTTCRCLFAPLFFLHCSLLLSYILCYASGFFPGLMLPYVTVTCHVSQRNPFGPNEICHEVG